MIFKILKYYYSLNDKGILINNKKFYKNNNPKISIISAVYNKEKYILRFIRSIQNQNFNDIEIIFIDDFSNDTSVKEIEKYKIEDERIILLKNKINKGTLISRNIAALKSKGEFLIFPDTDDILSQDILNACYETAIKYDFDLIRFNMYSEGYFLFSMIPNNFQSIIYQPELRTFLIYGYGFKKLFDGIISNKFIKKKIFMITLNNINKYYLNKRMTYFEDGLINFALHLNANSLYLMHKIGYYYKYNKESISHSLDYNMYFKCFFIYLKFIIENTKNNKYEKEMNVFLFNQYMSDNQTLYNITKFFNIYEEVINSLLKIKYISLVNKMKIQQIKKLIFNNIYKINFS